MLRDQTRIAFTPDGTLLAGGLGHAIHNWKEVDLRGHAMHVHSVTSATNDKSLRIWNTKRLGE